MSRESDVELYSEIAKIVGRHSSKTVGTNNVKILKSFRMNWKQVADEIFVLEGFTAEWKFAKKTKKK